MARKEKKYHFIYKTTNVLSGKYYIGMHSTSNLDDGYMGSGTRLRYSINKYGKDNHRVEILEFVDSRAELKSREKELVNLNEIAKIDCMNLQVGGEGGFKDNEHMMKCSKAGNIAFLKKMENDEYRKLHAEDASKNAKKNWVNRESELCKKMMKNLDWTGLKHSDETKQKMSESKKGKGTGKENSQYGSCWITNGIESKKIKKEELDSYTRNGWEQGRKINTS